LVEPARMPLFVHTCLSAADPYPVRSLISCTFKALHGSSSYLCRANGSGGRSCESLGLIPVHVGLVVDGMCSGAGLSITIQASRVNCFSTSAPYSFFGHPTLTQ
jgi:hypothetical protein